MKRKNTNKYQEALDFFKSNVCPLEIKCEDCDINHNCDYQICVEKQCETLQELVERVTPKKVMFIDSQRRMYRKKWGKNSRYDGVCSNCGKHVYPGNKYCSGCGQAIDWSE